MKSAKLSYLK